MLKNKINEDLKQAMLNKAEHAVTALRGLRGAILEVEVAEGKRDTGLTDEEIEQVIQREIKKRNESLRIYKDNGRNELADKEQAEIDLFSSYLPKQLTDEEISTVIDEVLQDQGNEVVNMGKIIGAVKSIVGSKADGGRVAKLVQEQIR